MAYHPTIHNDNDGPPGRTMQSLEARVGFEPTNGGFADLSLGPLGYRAELLSIAKLTQPLGVAASSRKLTTLEIEPEQERCALTSEATMKHR